MNFFQSHHLQLPFLGEAKLLDTARVSKSLFLVNELLSLRHCHSFWDHHQTIRCLLQHYRIKVHPAVIRLGVQRRVAFESLLEYGVRLANFSILKENDVSVNIAIARGLLGKGQSGHPLPSTHSFPKSQDKRSSAENPTRSLRDYFPRLTGIQEINIPPQSLPRDSEHLGIRRSRSDPFTTMSRDRRSERRNHSVSDLGRIQREEPSKNIKFQADGAGQSTIADPPVTAKRDVSSQLPKEGLIRPGEYKQLPLAPLLPQLENHFGPSKHHERSVSMDPSSSRYSSQFVPSQKPHDVVEIPQIRHARVSLETKSNSPLYTGGATLEGEVEVTVDGGRFAKRHKDLSPLSMGRITVDLIGVEIWNGKHNIFHSLAVDAVNENHPPPGPVLASAKPVNGFWTVAPSLIHVPFQFVLPIKAGPPPYLSKHASIRYILCATAVFKTLGREFSVRDSCDIAILTVHNRRSTTNPPPSLQF